MPVEVPYLTMHNGRKYPQIGLGNFSSKDPKELKPALKLALEEGYRCIDTAFLYQNEEIIGETLQEVFKEGKLARHDIFIETKLPYFCHKPEDAEEMIAKQLRNLQTDYIDLFLIHWGMPAKKKEGEDDAEKDPDGKLVPALIPFMDTWKVLEKYYKKGVFKSIGLSNFTIEDIQKIYDEAEVKPHNYQGECHILLPEHERAAFLEKLKIIFTAYAPIGSPGRYDEETGDTGNSTPKGDVLGHPVPQELAKKYNKTPAQILLRHLIQRGLAVIPKSVTPEHIKDNINIFDFELAEEDVKKLDDIKERQRLFLFQSASTHPWFPFPDAMEQIQNGTDK